MSTASARTGFSVRPTAAGRLPIVPVVDELGREIAAVHAHRGDPDALHGALRRARLVVATAGDDAVASVADRGLHWLCGFTSTDALARFGVARGGGHRPWPFRTLLGAELLDRWVPAARAGGPVGLAIDLAGTRPMVFPPGITR